MSTTVVSLSVALASEHEKTNHCESEKNFRHKLSFSFLPVVVTFS
jgi:hypothetical protein